MTFHGGQRKATEKEVDDYTQSPELTTATYPGRETGVSGEA
jgi:hypothetical protein